MVISPTTLLGPPNLCTFTSARIKTNADDGRSYLFLTIQAGISEIEICIEPENARDLIAKLKLFVNLKSTSPKRACSCAMHVLLSTGCQCGGA